MALAARLEPIHREALTRFLVVADETLAAVYTANVADHHETRGDDAQLFGLKVWKHEWYALEQALIDDPVITLVALNGSYEVQIGPLRIGVYGIGDFAHEDVHQCFPDTSPTKRAFGEANQLRLFDLATVEPPIERSAYILNSLTLGHFGNPREGLVKWYLGAWTLDELGNKRWAWIERQDEPGQGVHPLPTRPPVVPFNERPSQALKVRPRRPA